MVFIGEALVSERHRLSIVSMFGEDHSSAQVLGQGCGHESRVVVECPDISFVSAVEEDWALFLIVVLQVNQVPHLVCGVVRSIKVVNRHIKEQFLWKLSSGLFDLPLDFALMLWA